METGIQRRDFVQLVLGGTLLSLHGRLPRLRAAESVSSALVSPGCRGTKVKLARLYLGVPRAHYPNPAIDLADEKQRYAQQFAQLRDELDDVDFAVDELITAPEQLDALSERIAACDGVLAVHLTLHTMPIITKLLAMGRPTMIFSAPYAGHEWYELSNLRRQKLGEQMDCVLTDDYGQLAVAVRPFRALHHLREAKVLNLASSQSQEYADQVKQKFGTSISLVSRERMLSLYDSINDQDAREETERWLQGAVAVVEPAADEVFRSCKLALAFQRLLDEEQATVMTVDCYGSMWRRIPAYPCIGFARLNDQGLGGICQSDLPCAMVHILLQSLSGRPGFVCNPTFDFVANQATLIHCLGSTKMDGPSGPCAPYKLRSIMEREEGAVPQVTMRVGQNCTQAMLDGTSTLRYFTGQITDAPDTERGCRTKIAVRVNGNAQRLWQNWTAGIHRVSCYGDLSQELAYFCRFAKLELLNEAV